MRIALLISFCFLVFTSNAQNTIGAVGTWREHYNNNDIFQVIKGDQYYLAAKNQIIAYNKENGQVSFLGKSNGLHEIGIQTIAWDQQNQQLIIAYTNSAIDIVQGDQVYLINDIKTTSLFNNKKIKNIRVNAGLAFVDTDFGLVIIDLKSHEIKETWQTKDLVQAETLYKLSSLPYIKSIDLLSDSIKGIVIGGPNKYLNGIASANETQLVIPYSNNSKGFATYTDQGWGNIYSLQNNTIPSLEFSSANPMNNTFWLANASNVYSYDGSQIQLVQTNNMGAIKNIAFSKMVEDGFYMIKKD